MKLLFGSTIKPEGWKSVDRSGGDYRIHVSKESDFSIFSDSSVDRIYSSHMIEHMPIEDVQFWFDQSYRMLKPGGILRVCAPDAIMFLREYKDDPNSFGKSSKEYGVGSGRNYYQEIEMWTNMLSLDPDHKAECLSPHNLLASEFCTYCDHPQYGHTFDKDTSEKLLGKIKEPVSDNDPNVDIYLDWVCSHYDTRRPAGHQTAFYSAKVAKMLKGSGFNSNNIHTMKFRDSHCEDIRTNPKIDLDRRRTISFYTEVIK